MNRVATVAICAGLFCGARVWANNIVVTNVTMPSLTGGYCQVQFNIRWDNSWRSDQADINQATPFNYDAAWVFLKYRTGAGQWQHATLSTNTADHKVPTNCALSVGLTGTNGVGVFLYRGTNSAGQFEADGVQLRWNYAANGVADGASVTVKVFAIEMVYVPQGAFYVGDGANSAGEFYGGGTNTPFRITNENSLAVGNTLGDLYYPAGAAYGDQSGPIPAAFPKGYAAFYGMKYEITQGQYADFLNTIGAAQATARYSGMTTYRQSITVTNGVFYSASLPYVACNYLNWADLTAYLDWAALRPMTELEFEKACRGPISPVLGEYAWGSTSISNTIGIANSGQANEVPSNSAANCMCNQGDGGPGPMRVGCMGLGTGLRVRTGAGYYGMMDLSGNVWEEVVSVGDPTGRAFTATHGDGVLDASGNANVSSWPTDGSSGAGNRGGDWHNGWNYDQASERLGGNGSDTPRQMNVGGRGVRSAS
jgi:formylglycine-generating enzyme required for sulfatase activity